MMEERFIAVWVMLPIVAADLRNELKKNSTWSSGDLTTDWRLAVLRHLPSMLLKAVYMSVS